MSFRLDKVHFLLPQWENYQTERPNKKRIRALGFRGPGFRGSGFTVLGVGFGNWSVRQQANTTYSRDWAKEMKIRNEKKTKSVKKPLSLELWGAGFRGSRLAFGTLPYHCKGVLEIVEITVYNKAATPQKLQ